MTAHTRTQPRWFLIWMLAFPVPVTIAACAVTAFVSTSFHSAHVGVVVGLALLGSVAAQAARMRPVYLLAFVTGVGITVIGMFGLFLYALAHSGPWG